MSKPDDRACAGRTRHLYCPCLRKTTIQHGGKWYCWQHDPAKEEAERERLMAERVAEEQRREAEHLRRFRMRDAGLRDIDDATLAAVERLGGLQAMIRRIPELEAEVSRLTKRAGLQDPGY